MKINWKERFKNKTFLITFATLVVAFVYQILALFGVVPAVSEDYVMNSITILINLLATLGVIIDPTTKGINDSARALTYGTENDVRETEDFV